ncbi:MAG TPA: hypothetical protein VHU91_03570 [Mycobacteriales bacterium]|nr:hypothetical protein [Mycobacteriales bacterium]
MEQFLNQQDDNNSGSAEAARALGASGTPREVVMYYHDDSYPYACVIYEVKRGDRPWAEGLVHFSVWKAVKYEDRFKLRSSYTTPTIWNDSDASSVYVPQTGRSKPSAGWPKVTDVLGRIFNGGSGQ